jgi:hypothetical protein
MERRDQAQGSNACHGLCNVLLLSNKIIKNAARILIFALVIIVIILNKSIISRFNVLNSNHSIRYVPLLDYSFHAKLFTRENVFFCLQSLDTFNRKRYTMDRATRNENV